MISAFFRFPIQADCLSGCPCINYQYRPLRKRFPFTIPISSFLQLALINLQQNDYMMCMLTLGHGNNLTNLLQSSFLLLSDMIMVSYTFFSNAMR